MLKNKMKTILVLCIMFVLVFCPLVKADNEENAATNTQEYAEESTQASTTQVSEDNTKKSDVYLFGDEVTVDYAVDGNAFICANTVNIKSKIGGDLFVCANTVNIENGYVYSNVFVCAKTLNLNGVVYDLYAACSKIDIGSNGYVYRDLRAGADTINLYGTVGRNAYIDCNSLSLSKDNSQNKENNGMIYGDLNYTSDTELEIAESIVEGNINFNKRVSETTSWTDIVLSIITSIVFTVLVCLVLMWIAPKFRNKLSETLTTKIGSVLGFGALALILTPIITFILLLTQIGASAAILLATIYAILIAISSSIFIITIANIISNKANINNKWITVAIVAGISLVYALLKLVPYVSSLVVIIFVWVGSGIIIRQILPSNNSKID